MSIREALVKVRSLVECDQTIRGPLKYVFLIYINEKIQDLPGTPGWNETNEI